MRKGRTGKEYIEESISEEIIEKLNLLIDLFESQYLIK